MPLLLPLLLLLLLERSVKGAVVVSVSRSRGVLSASSLLIPQMSAKQSRIEKLKLEVRKLEAERDGLKQVREWASLYTEQDFLSSTQINVYRGSVD